MSLPDSGILAEDFGKHWRKMLFLGLLTIAAVVVSLVIARKVLRDRRTAVRLLRDSEARDESRLARRLANLDDRRRRAEDKENQDDKETDGAG